MAKRTVEVFLDSNVILSGLLSDKGAPRILLDLLTLKLPFLTGSTGRYNLIEIERTLRKKIPQILPVYKRYFPKLNLKIVPMPKADDIKAYSGNLAEKDVPVLLSTIRSKTDFLVTEDKKYFQILKAIEEVLFKIVTPSELIDHILPEIFKELEKADD